MADHDRIAEAARIASRNYAETVDVASLIRDAVRDVRDGKVPSEARLALLTSDPAEHPSGGILDQAARLEGQAEIATDEMERVAALVLARMFEGVLRARIEGATREATRGDAG